jgi:hypothetical protein
MGGEGGIELLRHYATFRKVAGSRPEEVKKENFSGE